MPRSSTAARVAALIASVAVLVVLFIVLGEDDEDGGDDTAAAPATTTEAPTEPGVGEAGEGGEEPPEPEIPTVVVSGGEPEGGVAELRYGVGERARFRVRSDIADEVHVHGYDLFEDVAPGEPARFDFVADIDGIYEVELERSGVEIIELRVDP